MVRGSAVRAATLFTVVALGGVGFLPLFGGPGYEAAVAAGLVLPGLAACATAIGVTVEELSPFEAFVRGCGTGVLLSAVALALSFLHGLRAGFCDPVEGAELFLLGPGAGAVMGGVWGAAVGVAGKRLEKHRRVAAIAGALVGPLLGIAVSFWRFYTSPMVFAFDPFFGFFAGTLYDSVITGLGRLATYRIGSLATLIATGAAAAALERGRGRAVLLALAAAAASIVHAASGPSLGHYQTTASIRAALGQSVTEGRCELVYPTGTPDVEAHALAHECDGHLAQLDRFFEVEGPAHVTAFLFASPEQKGYLMGAAGTYIAKPWRREIYVQRAGFPHPVMRHELAHVVAGTFASGPFRVSGPMHGWIPDPGRIEGVAVAAAPHDEELSLEEWARAMRDLSLLPPLERVFKLTFLGEPSSRAYVVAGAFIDWLRREKGVAAVRRWYGGASIETATGGASLGDLERAWTLSLDQVRVGDDVRHVARARFDQPAIFGRRCPHVVDRIAQEAGAALGQLDTTRARRLYQDLLALDPHDLGARLGVATCALRDGKNDEARRRYEEIAKDPVLSKAIRGKAVESLGDLSLMEGQGTEAIRRFDEVTTVVVDQDRQRTLDVKRYAASAPGRDAILAHLFGNPRIGRDATFAAAALGAWAEREPDLGMADYLLARLHLGDGRWQLATESLDRALGRTLPIPSVLREAYRLRVIAACATGDHDGVVAAFRSWSKLDGPRPPERAEMAEFVLRCTADANRPFTETQTPKAQSSTAPSPPSVAPDRAPPDAPRAAAGGCPGGMVRIPEAET